MGCKPTPFARPPHRRPVGGGGEGSGWGGGTGWGCGSGCGGAGGTGGPGSGGCGGWGSGSGSRRTLRMVALVPIIGITSTSRWPHARRPGLRWSVSLVAPTLVRAAPSTSWSARRCRDPSLPRRADGTFGLPAHGGIADRRAAPRRCPPPTFGSSTAPHPHEPVPCSRSSPRSPRRRPRGVPAPAGRP
jgi:hypothetical protein